MLNIVGESRKNECENTTKKWAKTCPKCNCEQIYSSRRSLWNGISKNKPCPSCVNSGKNNPFYGKTHTKAHIKSLSENQKNCSYRYKNTTGKNPPKINKICKNEKCSKSFSVTVGQKKRLYCCYQCALNDKFGFSKMRKTAPEKMFERMLKKHKIKYKYGFVLGGKIYDFYIPKKNLLVEVDGIYWHAKGISKSKMNFTQLSNRRNDLKKDDIAKKNGYALIRIWEDELEENKCIKIFS